MIRTIDPGRYFHVTGPTSTAIDDSINAAVAISRDHWLREGWQGVLVICAGDCARVMADPAAFPPAVDAEEFFHRLGLRPPKDAMQLILQSRDQPCPVGFPLKRDQDCTVVQDIVPTEGFFRDLQRGY